MSNIRTQPAILVNGTKIESRSANENTQDKIEKLRSSVEEKRKVLAQLYEEASATNMENTVPFNVVDTNSNVDTKTKPSILKHVHFESSDDDDESKAKLNLTYKIEKLVLADNRLVEAKVSKTTSKENVSTKKYDTQMSPNKILKTQTKPPNKVSTIREQSPGKPNKADIGKVEKTGSFRANNRSNNIKALVPSTRPVLTVQQKRELAKQEESKFLREIQIIHNKVLMRKFAYIWLRRHFYSNTTINNANSSKALLLPSQLEKYRQNKVVSVVLHKWHDETVWVRNEWRWTIKAQCHHNYVLLNKLWARWKEYTAESQVDNIVLAKAVSFCDLKLKANLFQAWKSQTLKTIRSRLKLLQTQKELRICLMKEYLSMWYMKTKQRKQLEQMTALADSHYKLVQYNKIYSVWYYKFRTGKDDRNAHRLAEKHYRTAQLDRCFQALKYYVAYRKKKQVQKQKLNEYADSQLVYRVYHTWLAKYEERKRMIEIDSKIAEFRDRFTMVRILERWRNQYKSRLDLKERELKMKKLYQKKLKRKAFDLIKENYLSAEQERQNEKRADMFSNFWFKKKFYTIWADRFEEKSDMKTIHLLCKARIHHEQKLLKNCFHTWQEFRQEQHIISMQNYRAEEFHKRNLQKKYFSEIRKFVELTQVRRQNYNLAIAVCNENTYQRYYYRWVNNYQQTIELQMNMRIAILHHDAKQKENVLRIWHRKLKSMLNDECLGNRAVMFYKKTLVKKLFYKWKGLIDESKAELNNENLAYNFYVRRTCLPIFRCWKKFLEETKEYELKLNSADKYYQNKQMKNVFKTWKSRVVEFKEINFQVECKYQQKKREKSLEILNHLKQNALDNKRERHCENLATAFYLRNLMLKIVTEWKIHSSRKALKRQNEADQITKFVAIKSKITLSNYYARWKKRTDEMIYADVKYKAAVEFNQLKNKEKSLKIWKTFVRNCARLTLMENQAKYFLEMRLKTEFYFKWHNEYVKELCLKEKNQNALVFWSVSIQRKCLQAWMNWILLKRAKKERYKAALDKRQLDTLKVCGRNFIQYSTDSKIRRLEANKLLKENDLVEKIRLQSKYFNIWLEKCNFFKNKKRIIRIPALKEPQSTKQIVESSTLEHKEIITGVKSDLVCKPRPAPRKPSYLIDSIDVNTNPPINNTQPFDTHMNFAEMINPIKSIELNEPAEVFDKEALPIQMVKKNPTVLLPPSAFSSVNIFNDNNKQAINGPNVEKTSPTLCLNKLPIASCSSVSIVSNCTNLSVKLKTIERKRQEQTQKELELIEFKKMLENLAIKSDNLKRLKEQERLLNKCIESSENNKTLSFCGTIYEEKDQVVIEIEELTKFIKSEKQKITDLAKKYKLKV